MELAVSLFLLLGHVVLGIVAQPTAGDRTNFLNGHNTIRAKYGLNPLQWDNRVAQVAQNYANKCIWGHNLNSGAEYAALGGTTGLGENIHASTPSATAAGAVSSWNREESDWNCATNACNGVCGHFTQNVWSSTTLLGCGMKKCTTGSPFGNPNWENVVCNYGPPGNFRGQRPFPVSSCGGVQTTGPQTTGAQTTGAQTTGPQTTGVQTTGVQTTGPQTTGVQTTGVQTTGVITTGVRTTGVQTTGVQTTGVQTTGVITTGVRTTGVITTGVQTTGPQTTGAISTGGATTSPLTSSTGIPSNDTNELTFDPNNIQDANESGASMTAAIAGGGAGVVLLLLIIAVAVGYFIYRQRRNRSSSFDQDRSVPVIPLSEIQTTRMNTESSFSAPSSSPPAFSHSPSSSYSPSYSSPSVPTEPRYGGPPRPGGALPPRPGGPLPPRTGGAAPVRPGAPRPGGPPPRSGGPLPPRPGGAAPARPGGALPPRPGGTTPVRPGGNIPTGKNVMATYSGDGRQYRAVVAGFKNGSYLVRYPEFNNDQEWLPPSAVRPL